MPDAGWYQNPDGSASMRYWDGDAWTSNISLRPTAPPRQPKPRQPTQPVASLPSPALMWALTTLVVDVTVVAVFSVIYRLVARPPLILGLLLYYGCVYGVLYASCRTFSRRHGSGSLRTDYGLCLEWRDSYRGLGVWLLGSICAAVAASPFIQRSRFQGTNTQALQHYRHNPGVYVALAFIAIVAAPFFEELFFRGLLFRALLGRLPVAVAITLQAVVFGLIHYNPYYGTHNVSVVVALGTIGIVLGWSANRFARLGPGMVAHCLQNTLAVVAALARRAS